MISALSGSSHQCQAADAASAAQKFFNRLDRDGDGKISAEEFTSAMQKRFGRDESDGASGDATAFAEVFKKLDADGDGQINQDEFKTGLADVRDALRARAGERHRGPDPKKIFAEADADQSGTVTAEELKTHFEQNFAAKHPGAPAPDFAKLVAEGDKDGDGALSESEFTALRPPPPRARAVAGALDAAALFKTVDADEDGLISLEEFTRHLTAQSGDDTSTAATGTSPDFSKLFASFDDDEDGKLSQTELEAMLEQVRRLELSRERAGRYDPDGARTNDASTQSGRLDATA